VLVKQKQRLRVMFQGEPKQKHRKRNKKESRFSEIDRREK
jgi:hypothetical protein